MFRRLLRQQALRTVWSAGGGAFRGLLDEGPPITVTDSVGLFGLVCPQDQFKFMNSELQKQADLLLSKWHQSAAARTKDMISCLRKMSGKNLKRLRAEDERLYKLELWGGHSSRKSSCLNRTLGVPNDMNGATMVALLKPLLLFACSYPSPLVLFYLKGEGYMIAENMDIHLRMDNALFTSLLHVLYLSV